MSFGLYVHIPYCLQRCTYCDFATYVYSPSIKEIMPPDQYLGLLKTEIQRGPLGPCSRTLDTVYFGGGTPSLLEPAQIQQILDWVTENDFTLAKNCEVTIEVNPATLNEAKLEGLLAAGVNRFSLGFQTMSDEKLKFVHRKHSSSETLDTVALFKKYRLNFSLDLLFALPHQTLPELEYDLKTILDLDPNHVSPYCLTVNEGHALSKLRPLDEIQLQMFQMIDDQLARGGYERYEISNYSKPGFRSRHNCLYWDDHPYWGIGLSAHSFNPQHSPFGTRYWNSRGLKDYEAQFKDPEQKTRPENQIEILKPWEALTDFCHTSLRRSQGLDLEMLEKKFGPQGHKLVLPGLVQMQAEGLLDRQNKSIFSLSPEGVVVSNRVFQILTFLEPEWQPRQ